MKARFAIYIMFFILSRCPIAFKVSELLFNVQSLVFYRKVQQQFSRTAKSIIPNEMLWCCKLRDEYWSGHKENSLLFFTQ